ncbi:MAG: Imm50 family immunity protein [Pseudomonadota bacterium]
MISHAETVESVFGYWPEFSDGRIELFSFERPGIICLRISYIDSNIQKAAIVSLRFSGVTDIELSELLSENIVDVLSISSESPSVVTIESCYGLCGSFKCTAAEVTGVVPNHSFKADGSAAA